MSKLNGSGHSRRIWRTLPVISGERLVPDEMVRAFVAVGSPEKVRERIEPVWQLADSICVSPPAYALTPEKLQYYTDMIATTFPSDSL